MIVRKGRLGRRAWVAQGGDASVVGSGTASSTYATVPSTAASTRRFRASSTPAARAA